MAYNDTLALHLPMVTIADRMNASTCWVAHTDCAERIVQMVNESSGFDRLYLYGPAGADACAATDCAHTTGEGE